MTKDLQAHMDNELADMAQEADNEEGNPITAAMEDALDNWFQEKGITDEQVMDEVRSRVHLKIGVWFDEKSMGAILAKVKPRVGPTPVHPKAGLIARQGPSEQTARPSS